MDRIFSIQQNGNKRSILNNAAYSIFTSSETRNAGGKGHGLPRGDTGTTRRVNYNVRESSSASSTFLQRSVSADNVVVRQRGFKPSDRHDPAKRNFLESLTSKILHFDMESGSSTPIDLQKLLTPASDSNELLHVKNKKMYASSYFYAPTHPTVEDQVELARRISNSLSDVKNVKSKGQSMYVNRKKRSVKWIHDGNGVEDEEEPSSPIPKDKIPLKYMMNPSGKVLDIHGIQALGEEVNIQTTPPHPERLFDIVRDLNNQKGRGAEIFAKRRKRSEKWVVDTEQPQSPSNFGYGKAPTYPMKQEISGNENSNKPFYNPFAIDNSMDYSTPPTTSCAHRQCSRASFSSAHSDCGPCHTEVKKIYLREIAVGTEPEPKIIEKPRRTSFSGNRSCNSSVSNGYTRINRGSRLTNGANNGHHHHHHYQPNGHQVYSSRSNGYHKGVNGYHQPPLNDYHRQSSNGYHQQPSNGYHQQPSNGYHQQPSNGYHQQLSNGYHRQSTNGYHQESTNGYERNNEDITEDPVEDYTPVPVKQLIQEFEKTCRPVIQYKQYAPRVAPVSNSQNDLSRYFESRREVVYRRAPIDQLQRGQYRNNGYASSDEDEEEEEDDDDEASLDDSLSPVDVYRLDDRRFLSQNNTGNRSSSMSTLDEYYRRQLQAVQYLEQQEEEMDGKRFVDSEMEVPPATKAMSALAAVASHEDILNHKKHLKHTPVLENLVAGTTTPECFKKEYTEDVAPKLYESTYHGPKISSYQNLANYNTAPRGWDQSQSVYRPIKFEKLQNNKIAYSDF